jgi:superfamily II DNA/RNA helicase
MFFKDLIPDADILKAIEEAGYTSPTPIQEQAIPLILEGKDLRASAQTGTGKTAAFILPCLCKLKTPSTQRAIGPRVLILVPTRELAMQVAAEAVKYSKYLQRARTVCVYGGAPYPVQNRELARPYDILVATPGRLIDHMQQGRINFSRLEILILDEADRMLDMGFIEPVELIAAKTPKSRQTLMFSATLKGAILNLSNRLLTNPSEVRVSPDTAQHANIEQRLHLVDNIEHKQRLLTHFLSDSNSGQTIVFTSTKRHAEQLMGKLLDAGHKAAALHGDMNQNQRTRTILRLRRGEVRILVATDVAARGIDVQTITHVINFDLPRNPEDYVHRIGRTGRASTTGIALSFAAHIDLPLVRRIEQFTSHKIPVHQIAGMEPKPRPQQLSQQRPAPGKGRPKGNGGGPFKPSFNKKKPPFKRNGAKSSFGKTRY